MPELDVECKLIFMNGSFGALLGDCRVLQFEGMVEVFVVKEYNNFMNGSFGALFGDCRALQSEGMVVFFVVKEYKNLLSRQVLGDCEEFVIKGTILGVPFQLEHA